MYFGDATPPSRSVHQPPVGFDQALLRSVLQRRRGRRRSNVFWRRDAPVAFRSPAASLIRLGPVAFRPSTATRASPLQRILETRRPRRVPFTSRQSDSIGLRCVPPFDGDEGVAAPMYFGDATPPSRSVHQPPVGFDQAPLRSVLQRRRGRRRSNVFWRRDAPVAFRSPAASLIRPGPVAFRSSTATRASPLQRILETRRPRRVPYPARPSAPDVVPHQPGPELPAPPLRINGVAFAKT